MDIKKSISSFIYGEETCFQVYGFKSCPYYQKAVSLGESLEKNHGNITVDIVPIDRNEWSDVLEQRTQDLGGKAVYHRTCPLVQEGCDVNARKFVGGYSDFLNEARKRKYKYERKKD
ncbi:hypothetical protein DFA_10774 [Cavenderia fasciculata]|uniref:Glutaredoxin domain-containing protein n=1 Tax=Cavenderia fasciculata TaxID=261658 RepID=F4QBC9_CACFS|nr:uncharacterized protein DFA_10774 [Cavenderia fasciculata]EGG14901.1 hypothetical protein DFA_10774 [Cavenderia fasciculata]|eukprot:XP_004351417.1 hypothetical protein DFA_10774 [Cavenderia fasciculata]